MVAFRTYRKGGKRYRAYFKRDGRIYSQTVATKAEGEKWAAAKKAELDAAMAEPAPSPLMYSAICAEYLQDCSGRMRPQTVAEKYRHLTHFAEAIGQDLPAMEITPTLARRFLAGTMAARGAKTANRYRRNLAALFAFHMREGQPLSNPFAAVAAYAEEDPERRVPTKAEVAAVLLAAEPWERDYLTMLATTAARPGEIRRLEWRHVDLDRKVALVWTRKRKGGAKQYRPLPLTPSLAAILLRCRERCGMPPDLAGMPAYVFANPLTGDRYSRNSRPMKYLMERLCRKAGVEHFTLKALRHFAAQALKQAGRNTGEISKLLGHQRITTTDTYLEGLCPDLAGLGAVMDEILARTGESMHCGYAPGGHTGTESNKKGAPESPWVRHDGGEGGI